MKALCMAIVLGFPLYAHAAAAADLSGIYQGSLPDEGRTLYLSLSLQGSEGTLHGSFTVGTGPDFAQLVFPTFAWDSGSSTFSGQGSGTFHGRALWMSLACRVQESVNGIGSLGCTSAYPDMAPASFTLRK